jgi:hypothetical protein
MSKPKRYHLEMQKADDGDWVLYDDYARLKAEVERLTAFTTRTIIPNEELQAQVERLMALVESNLNQSKLAMAKSDASVRTLEAQVERLTKAGDAMANNIVWVELYRPLVAKWNAAKEGKPRD